MIGTNNTAMRSIENKSSLTADGEKMLIAACQAGERQAWQEVVARFTRPVYATSLRILRNPAEAEESTQDTFVKVMSKIHTFRQEASLSTWIYRIAMHTALNRLEAWKRKTNRLRPEEAGAAAAEPRPLPDQIVEQGQLLALVQQTLDDLPEEQRLILILGDIEGLPYAQLAEVLEIPLGTAKSRLHRARALLRDKLRPHLTPRCGENR